MELNYLAILVSAVVGMILGALWYSPLLFGKAWMKLTGMTEEQAKADMKDRGAAKMYLVAFLAVLLMAYVMAYLMNMMDGNDVVTGLQAGFWIWLGFIATTMINPVLWQKQPLKLYFMNTAHYLVALLVMGAILGGWQ